jgi:hypothetical protein
MNSTENHISPDELLKAVEQMSLPELERFVDKAIALKAHRKAPHLSKDESELLDRINHWLPSHLKPRLDSLLAKREAETLAPEEEHELTALTDELEEAHAQRVEALAALANQRGITLREVMNQLGIHFPDYA